MEAAQFANDARWSGEDCADRRKRHGQGKVSLWPPAACETALGVWHIRSQHGGPHRAH